MAAELELCGICKKELKADDTVIQVRSGLIDEDNITFLVDHDEGYYHSSCFDEVKFPKRQIV